MMKNSMIAILGLLVFSCQPNVDPQMIKDFEEIRSAQDWYFDQIIARNVLQLDVTTQNRGALAEEVAIVEKLQALQADYQEVLYVLENAYYLNRDGDDVVREVFIDEMQLKDAANRASDFLITQGIDWRGFNSSKTEDLLFDEMMFRKLGMEIIRDMLIDARPSWIGEMMLISRDNNVEVREIYHVLDGMDLNGIEVRTNAEGVFQIPEGATSPYTLEWKASIPGIEDLEGARLIVPQ